MRGKFCFSQTQSSDSFSYLHVFLLLSDVTHAFQDLLRLIVLR